MTTDYSLLIGCCLLCSTLISPTQCCQLADFLSKSGDFSSRPGSVQGQTWLVTNVAFFSPLLLETETTEAMCESTTMTLHWDMENDTLHTNNPPARVTEVNTPAFDWTGKNGFIWIYKKRLSVSCLISSQNKNKLNQKVKPFTKNTFRCFCWLCLSADIITIALRRGGVGDAAACGAPKNIDCLFGLHLVALSGQTQRKGAAAEGRAESTNAPKIYRQRSGDYGEFSFSSCASNHGVERCEGL